MNHLARLMHGAVVILALISGLAAVPGNVKACTCFVYEDPIAEAEQADTVFLAQITEVEVVEYDNSWLMRQFRRWFLDAHGDGSRRSRIRASFEVVEPYKGISDDAGSIFTLTSSGMCGYLGFEAGKRTLIYAVRDKDGPLLTSMCTRTRPADGAQAEIETLRAHF